MKKQNKRKLYAAFGLLAAFMCWTAMVCLVDVQTIGPQGSSVGFASVNRFFHELTGVHMLLYTVTDWLSLIPIGFMCGFAWLGLIQWVRRKSLMHVDRSILALGGFYIAVLAAYVIFEWCVVNYRPVLIDGNLEASYPSSTTMLVLTVMSTAVMQLKSKMKNSARRCGIVWGIIAFTAFIVVGRVVSGVHWITDVIGGILLSAGLVKLYDALAE